MASLPACQLVLSEVQLAGLQVQISKDVQPWCGKAVRYRCASSVGRVKLPKRWTARQDDVSAETC